MAKNASSANSIFAENTTHGNGHDQTHNHNQIQNNKHEEPKQEEEELPFYPAFCFRASPTHFSWVKMSAADIHRLQTKRGFEVNLFFYKNHPIQFVALAGYIVSREDYERRTVLNVDDSSGAIIEVVVLKAPVQDNKDGPPTTTAGTNVEMTTVSSTSRTPIDISPLRIGTAVKLKGTLSSNGFKRSMQVVLERFWELPDTSAEIAFWAERSRVLIDILSTPWYLSPAEIESLRKQTCDEEVDAAKARQKTAERKQWYQERELKYERRILRRWEAEEELREKECEKVRESNKRLERWLVARRSLPK